MSSKQVQDAYIVAATRTPIGKSGRGFFRNTRPDDLLVAAVRSALANLRRKIEAATATITVDQLPRVMANPHLLALLFQNLISNAVKFRSENRQVTIRISAVESEREVTFAVADNGIGMAEEHFARAFQLFQRLNPAEQYSGAGIGLATCKKIVEHHDGRIWIESRLDVGTTFFFSLPRSS